MINFFLKAIFSLELYGLKYFSFPFWCLYFLHCPKKMSHGSHINFFTMNKTNRKEIFILIFCLFIGFALRFYTFDQKSLWMDEIYTFNDSRDDFKGQLRFYGENPTFLHPPLFFILTHLFYPFPKPERDLRIIPLIFGTLSIPMIYYSIKIILSCHRSSMYPFFNFHGLSYQSLPRRTFLFLAYVPWNDGSLFFYETLENIKEGILGFCCTLFCHSIPYKLQLYPVYCSIPDSLVLSDRRKQKGPFSLFHLHLKWPNHYSSAFHGSLF